MQYFLWWIGKGPKDGFEYNFVRYFLGWIGKGPKASFEYYFGFAPRRTWLGGLSDEHSRKPPYSWMFKITFEKLDLLGDGENTASPTVLNHLVKGL